MKSRLGQTGPASFCLCICSSGRQTLIKNKTQRSSRGTGQPPSPLLPDLSRLPRAAGSVTASRAARPRSPARATAAAGAARLPFVCLIIQVTTWGEIRTGTGNADYVLPCSRS